jgi:hypothetical protein
VAGNYPHILITVLQFKIQTQQLVQGGLNVAVKTGQGKYATPTSIKEEHFNRAINFVAL